MHFDVFNGDADGIIALVQLRLAQPKKSVLVTGVKRDISLLEQVDSKQASSVTVLDISLEKNIDALQNLLNDKVEIFYVDHHRTGEIPVSKYLTTHINTDPNTCTSLLVNEYLQGKYVYWAIAAAFGDNMHQAARELAHQHGLNKTQQDHLEALGVYVNYNGYGRSVDDLHFHPAKLFELLLNYENPFTLIDDKSSVFTSLETAYQEDMSKAASAQILYSSEKCKVVLLDDAPWSRRVSGVYGNELANNAPESAHAVLTLNTDSTYTVSVRAPLSNKQGADIICSQFPTGGGRAAAAGVNKLPQEMLEGFIQVLSQYYQ
ncbi:DHH family phosphoesterase [Colwelliaceae bacterium 6471]